MNALREIWLAKQWGTIFIALCAFLPWLSHRLYVHHKIDEELSQHFPNSRRKWWPVPFLAGTAERREVAQSALFVGTQRMLVLIACLIAELVFIRTLDSQQATEMARGGALLSVGALLSIYWGFREEVNIERYWSNMAALAQHEDDKAAFKQRGQAEIEAAKQSSQTTSFRIGIIGTLIWAFGDQVTACGAFHSLRMKDLSGVSCFSGEGAASNSGVVLRASDASLPSSEDTRSVPFNTSAHSPLVIDRRTGGLTLYLSFLGDGGPLTFDPEEEKKRSSVTLTDEDRSSLRLLTDQLAECGSVERPVRVSIRGFATTALALNIRADLIRRLPRFEGPAARANCTASTIATSPSGNRAEIADALSCINAYRQNDTSVINPSRKADAAAFNVYLANRRSERVETEIKGNAAFDPRAISISRKVWESEREMRSWMASSDGTNTMGLQPTGTAARAAALSIDDTGSCRNILNLSSFRLQFQRPVN